MGIIAIHGGLDTSREKPYLEVLQEAGLKGYQLLDRGYIQALEAAINTLEDSPKFNCGYGSVLNLNGVAEMDASIVDGATGRFSAVAAIRQIRNPISVARRLMEKTGQVLLAGQGAFEFAQKKVFPRATASRRSSSEPGKRVRTDWPAACLHLKTCLPGWSTGETLWAVLSGTAKILGRHPPPEGYP